MAPHDPLWALVVVNATLVGAAVYLGLSLRKLRLYVKRLAQDKGKAVTEELVALWHKRRSREPIGSALHRAYTQRLIEVGDLDENGNRHSG